MGTQTDFDIAQAFPVSDLRKGHAKVLIEAGKLFHFVIALIPRYTASKGMHGHEVHDLRENEFADVHELTPPVESQGDIRSIINFKSITRTIGIFTK